MQTNSVTETYALASRFLETHKSSQARKTAGAFVVLLEGDLGSGKTTFAQGIARALGITETVNSPTFVIAKNYQIQSRQGLKTSETFPLKKLIHIDTYRFETSAEAEVLGLEELFADSGNIILIEWPERIKEFLPATAHTIRLKFIDETTREIETSLVETEKNN